MPNNPIEFLLIIGMYLMTVNFCVLVGREFGSFEKFFMAIINIIKEYSKEKQNDK